MSHATPGGMSSAAARRSLRACVFCGLMPGNSAGVSVASVSLVAPVLRASGQHTTRSYGVVGLCARCSAERERQGLDVLLPPR